METAFADAKEACLAGSPMPVLNNLRVLEPSENMALVPARPAI